MTRKKENPRKPSEYTPSGYDYFVAVARNKGEELTYTREEYELRKKWRDKYKDQRRLAGYRGIEWHFTFEEWVEWWGEDIHRRGRGSNDLCMARNGDTGPYAPWNVHKATMAENRREAHTGRVASIDTRKKKTKVLSS